MAYTIIKTNGTVLTTIADGTVNNTSSSLELPGRNYAGYGVVMDTNLVHLLENFADSVVPANPIKGQLWYNTSTQSLYVCPADGETNINNWLRLLTSDNIGISNLTLPGDLVANNATITNDANANVVNTNYLNVAVDANLLGNSVISNIVANTITSGLPTGTITGNWDINGNIAPTGILTDNYYYANGNPVDFQPAAGSNTELQYNLDGNFGASPALSFDSSSNVLTVVGNVTANRFIGNGVGLTNVPAANLTGVIPSGIQSNITTLGTLPSLSVTGTATIGNISSNGNISANRLTGSLTTAAQPNITSLGNLTGLISTGQINFVNSSNVLLGNISNLKILGGTNGYVLSTNGAGDLSFVAQSSIAAGATGANTQIQYNNNSVMGASPNLTFNSSINVLDVNGNINSLNANLGNAVSANFFIGSGYNLANIRGSNILGQAPNAIVAGTVYTNAQPNITSVGTLTSLAVSSNISANDTVISNTVSTGNIAITNNGNITLTGPQSLISGANRVSANYITGTITTASQPNITSVGTLLSLSVTGTINSGNASLGNTVTANYFIGSGANLTNLPAGNISGSANITSLNVTNDIIASSVYANSGTIKATSLTGTLTTATQTNITSVGTLGNLAVTGNITSGNANLGNTVTASYFVGNGSKLTSIAGGNVTGTVANATYATSAGSANSVAGANVSGTVANATYATSAGTSTTANTVTNAVQSNITSVGTLTSLSVSGNANVSGNLNVSTSGIKFPDLNWPTGAGPQNAYIRFESYTDNNPFPFPDIKGTRLLIGLNSPTNNFGDFINIIAPSVLVNGYGVHTYANFKITYGIAVLSSTTFTVYPPSGFTMSNLYGFIPSINNINFAGVVDRNDSLYCTYTTDSSKITVTVYNSEQRTNASANWFAVWGK